MTKPVFSKWPSIDSFRNTLHDIQKFINKIRYVGPTTVTYRSKIKLHGTNAAIHVKDGKIVDVQKRTSLLNWPHNDNFGFGSWVFTHVKPVADTLWKEPNMVIHGEWVGPGVQKGVAASLVSDKFFAVFALEIQGETVDGPVSVYYTDPQTIEALIGNVTREVTNFFILPWFENETVVDFASAESIKSFVDEINEKVSRIEKVDPYIYDKYGVEGIGEGLVYYATSTTIEFYAGHLASGLFSRLMFKAKGEEHRVVKSRNAAELNIDPEQVADIKRLVDTIAPVPRLEQGLTEVFGDEPLNIRRISEYLKWVNDDVHKECLSIVGEAGYDWKTISKHVTRAASMFFKDKYKE